MTSTHRILVTSGQYLAAAALLASVALTLGPVANANLKEMQDCVSRGDKTFASCCIDSGGAYSFDPPNVSICVITYPASNEPPATVTKVEPTVPSVAPPPLENTNQPKPVAPIPAVPVKPRA
jgi:hypothetical protein